MGHLPLGARARTHALELGAQMRLGHRPNRIL